MMTIWGNGPGVCRGDDYGTSPGTEGSGKKDHLKHFIKIAPPLRIVNRGCLRTPHFRNFIPEKS
jgi:hypothetical protein